MATNPYFNLYRHKNEQKLLDDLVIESIRQVGMDMYYLPRTRQAFDHMYGEDAQSTFDVAYIIECYMKSIEGFMGLADMTKFGYQVHDRFTFTCAISRFGQEVTKMDNTIIRPREGDMLYFPMNKRLFEITRCENKPYFYQLGELQMYDMETEVVRPSGAKFNTGIEEIDAINSYTNDVNEYGVQSQDGSLLHDADGNLIVTDQLEQDREAFQPSDDNKEVADRLEQKDFVNFDEKDPFSEGPWK